MKSIKFIVLVVVLSYLFSCSDKNQNENLKQKLDTSIIKVDIPLDDNYYDGKYTNRKSKYYITIGKDTSDLITHVRESNTGTVLVYFNSGKNKIGSLIDTILFDTRFDEFEYLLTEIENDYVLDSLDGLDFPTLFQKAELEKNLSDVYLKTYNTTEIKGWEEHWKRTEYVLLQTPETTRLNNLLKKYSVKINGFSIESKFGISDTWNGSDTPPEQDSTSSFFRENDRINQPRIFIPYHECYAEFKRNVK